MILDHITMYKYMQNNMKNEDNVKMKEKQKNKQNWLVVKINASTKLVEETSMRKVFEPISQLVISLFQCYCKTITSHIKMKDHIVIKER